MRLNSKINFYEEDIDRFINTNFDKTSREFGEILNSRKFSKLHQGYS